jgi:hypothetical protein
MLGGFVLISTVLGGVLVVEDRFNQAGPVEEAYEAIKLTNLMLHNHTLESYDSQIGRLEAQVELTEADKVMLSFYKIRRRNVIDTLDELYGNDCRK